MSLDQQVLELPVRRDVNEAAPPSNKDQRIESLRGLAILLMVAGHVIGSDRSNGMGVSDDSIFRHFYFSLLYLRMPLFSVISGYVYSLRPVVRGKYPRFVRSKVRRILVPFVSVMTLQYLMRMLVPGVNRKTTLSNIHLIYIYGYDQFWFLQAIFLIFLAVGILDAANLMSTPRRWAGWLLLSLILDRSGADAHLSGFSIGPAIFLLPFFLFGCGIRRFPEVVFHPVSLGAAAFAFCAGIVIQQLCWAGHFTRESLSRFMVPTMVGLMGNLLLMRFFPVVPPLAVIGKYAYTIFLFHVFGTAGSRIVLHRLGIREEFVVFILGTAVGIFFPILVDEILTRSTVLRRVFLGVR